MRQDFQRTSGQGHQNFRYVITRKKCWDLIDSSETVPGVSSEISNAAIESVKRNKMLDFGKTTCKRIHPEPVIEKERSHSSEEHHAGLLVGTWYYLILDLSQRSWTERILHWR